PSWARLESPRAHKRSVSPWTEPGFRPGSRLDRGRLRLTGPSVVPRLTALAADPRALLGPRLPTLRPLAVVSPRPRLGRNPGSVRRCLAQVESVPEHYADSRSRELDLEFVERHLRSATLSARHLRRTRLEQVERSIRQFLRRVRHARSGCRATLHPPHPPARREEDFQISDTRIAAG